MLSKFLTFLGSFCVLFCLFVGKTSLTAQASAVSSNEPLTEFVTVRIDLSYLKETLKRALENINSAIEKKSAPAPETEEKTPPEKTPNDEQIPKKTIEETLYSCLTNFLNEEERLLFAYFYDEPEFLNLQEVLGYVDGLIEFQNEIVALLRGPYRLYFENSENEDIRILFEWIKHSSANLDSLRLNLGTTQKYESRISYGKYLRREIKRATEDYIKHPFYAWRMRDFGSPFATVWSIYPASRSAQAPREAEEENNQTVPAHVRYASDPPVRGPSAFLKAFTTNGEEKSK